MASNRSRSNRSVGNKLNSLDSRVAKNEKGTNNPHLSPDVIEQSHLVDGAVAEGKIAERAVTENKIARGAVGTEHLGIVNTITADSGLTLKPGPDGGFIVLDGPEYVAPASGSGDLYALAFNELNQVVVSTTGVGGGDGIAAMPAGSIQPWPTRTAPEGWLVCDGSAVSRATYSDLFSVLISSVDTGTFTSSTAFTMTTVNTVGSANGLQVGDSVFFTTTGALPTGISANTLYYVNGGGSKVVQLATTRTITATGYSVSNPVSITVGTGSGAHTMWHAPYGIGDGSTTFNVPDIRGRVVVGRNANDSEFDAMGEIGGAKTHTLTESQIPYHAHSGTTTDSGSSHRHWISAAAIDDRNFTGTGANNQDYGTVSDAGSYSQNDGDSGAGSYTSYSGSLHTHTFITSSQSGSYGGAHNNLQPYIALTYIIKHMVADGMQGPQGIQGETGDAATVAVGTTTTGSPGSVAAVTNAGTTSAAVLNFTIPRGDTGATGSTGPTGPSGTVTVGSTSTGAEGTDAAVTNSGTSTNAVLEFVIPRGNAASVAVGTTTTGLPDTDAEVTNSGDGSNAVFDFVIPAGHGATIDVGTVTTVTEDDPATVTNTGTNVDAIIDFEIPQGVTGNNAGVKYAFSTTTTDSDPGNGYIRFNNADPALATYIYIDSLDATGASQTAWYDMWDNSTSTNKGYITLSQFRTDSTAVFYVNNTVTNASGYYKIPVTYVSGALPANGAACFLNFSLSGNIGNEAPAGGDAGQILSKATDADYDFVWIDNYADWTSQVKHEVKAGIALTKGQAVYVTSADGTNMIVGKASNATEATSSKTMGLIMQDLALNGKGYVLTEGLLSGLNTSLATAGDPVWLGVDGDLIYGLTNKPYAPAHLVFIGIVTRSNLNNGEIFVQPQNGFELRELHDVLITNPTNGQALAYDEASGLWINTTPATTLDSLTDVELTAPLEDGQALTYDLATETWINATPATTLDSLTDVELAEPVTDGQALTYVAGLTRTNLVGNPNFETNITGWLVDSTGEVARTTAQSYSGAASAFITRYFSTAAAEYTGIPVTAGLPYTLSGYVKQETLDSDYVFAGVQWFDAGGLMIGSLDSGPVSSASPSAWTRISGTFTAPTGAVTAKVLFINTRNHYLDAVLFEQSATLGDYFDGATSGASWTGTANASTSTFVVSTSGWTNATPASTLDSLTDVDISTVAPVDGDILTYDATAEEWIAQSLGNAAMPSGSVMAWGGDVAPSGWLLCQGQEVSRTEYASLFSAIGTAFGAGDTVMTFNLPDLRGRTPFGRDAGQTEFDVLGETGGSKTTLFPTQGDGTSTGNGLAYSESMSSVDDGTYNNLPPYQTLNYIIKWASGETPTDESQLTDRVSDLETIVNTAYNQMPAGAIMAWASATAPSNWLICDGAAVSRTLYASLYATIGDSYGAGDGVTTFNVPNLKGRVPVGRDSENAAFDVLGETGGDQLLSKDGTGTATGYGLLYGESMDVADTTPTNMPPYQVVHYVIKATAGTTESDSALTNRVSTLEGTLGSIIPAGTIITTALDTAPTGWMFCDGAAISRSTYASLFAAIGTTYGAGDTVTTFNIPNLEGKIPFGRNSGDGGDDEFAELGQTGGSKFIQGHGSGTATGYGLTYSESVLTATGLTTAQNLPPYTVLNYMIRLFSEAPDAESEFVTRLGELETFVDNGGNESPAGSIMAWAAASAPANWLLCDGSVVLKADWPSLYNAIGNQYATGGETELQFRLPNLKGKVAVGLDSSQTEFDTLGETGGAKTHTLTNAEMPSHTHVQDAHTHTFSGTTSTNGNHIHPGMEKTYSNSGTTISSVNRDSGGSANYISSYAGDHNHTYSGTTSTQSVSTNQNTGGGGAHNNLQPYIVLNYIIKATAGVSTTDSAIVERVGQLELEAEFPIKLNLQTLTANYTIPVGYNGLSAGPIVIADGVTITIPDGSAWSVV